MKYNFDSSNISILGLLGVGLLLAGALGPWLDFPLSASLYTKDFVLPWPELGLASLQSLMLTIALVAGVGWLLGLRTLSLFAGVTAAVVLGYFFHSWVVDEQWLPRYLTESEQREALQAFVTHYYWPNLNPEPTATLESDFEYLLDQLRVFWYASGWGWGFCMLGIILLLLDNLFATPVVSFSSMAVFLFGGIAIAALLYPQFNAELEHRRADDLLGSGRPRAAISAYQSAMRMNPVLRHSQRFLIKAARAYYQMEGENSLLGGFYLASSRTRWVVGEPLSIAAKVSLKKAAKNLVRVLHASYHGAPLEMTILRQAAREYAKIQVEQGLDAYVEGEPSVSLSLFVEALASDRRQLHTGFYLAHVQRELGLVTDSVATLEEMLELVKHDSLRADLLCSIGDALSRGRRPLQARAAYTQCLAADSLFNFRAVLNLGGT